MALAPLAANADSPTASFGVNLTVNAACSITAAHNINVPNVIDGLNGGSFETSNYITTDCAASTATLTLAGVNATSPSFALAANGVTAPLPYTIRLGNTQSSSNPLYSTGIVVNPLGVTTTWLDVRVGVGYHTQPGTYSDTVTATLTFV